MDALTSQYYYTLDQLRDLAFVWAQNAVIVRHAMKTASAVADKTNTPLKDVFAEAGRQKEMSTFLSGFVTGLRSNPPVRHRGISTLMSALPWKPARTGERLMRRRGNRRVDVKPDDGSACDA